MWREFVLVLLAGAFFNLWLKKRDQARYLERDIENGRQVGRRRLTKLTEYIHRLKSQPWKFYLLEPFLQGFDAAVDILASGKEPEPPDFTNFRAGESTH